MGRLTAGRGADPYRTTTSLSPARRSIPYTPYQYGNPYEDFLDKKSFNKDYFKSFDYKPDKRFYPPGYKSPSKRSRPTLMKPAAQMSPATGPKGARGALPVLDPGPFPGKRGLWGAAFQVAYALLGELYPGEWATQGDNSRDHPYQFGSDWTVLCTGTPPGTHPNRKVGVFPGLPGISVHTCGVSGAGASNLPEGSALPGGLTYVQLVSSNSASPWPNRSGRVYMRASHAASPVSAPLPYAPTPAVMPMPEAAPAPAQATEQSSGKSASERARSGEPFSDWGWNFGGGPPSGSGVTVVPVGPYRPSAPPLGTKERKWKLGKGGAVGDLFGAFTEMADAVDCAYKAVGGKGNPGLQKKVQFVSARYDVGNQAHNDAFVSCMVTEQAKDMVIGLSSGFTDKMRFEAYEKLGVPLSKRPGRGVGIKRPPSPF